MFDDICKKQQWQSEPVKRNTEEKRESKWEVVWKIRNNADRKKATSNYINQADYLLQANVLQPV